MDIHNCGCSFLFFLDTGYAQDLLYTKIAFLLSFVLLLNDLGKINIPSPKERHVGGILQMPQ